jgi:glyceraldehyde 3-phosphate dehydrogenase
VLPELKGKLDGTAMRVPTPNVERRGPDLRGRRDVTVDEVNEAVRKAPKGRWARFWPMTRAQGLHRLQPHRAFLDLCPRPDQGRRRRMVRVLAWYDNEWGFSAAWPMSPWPWAGPPRRGFVFFRIPGKPDNPG